MTSKLSQEELEVLRSVPIHKILGLNDTGRRQSFKCPFHKERTPSFYLWPDNHYKCFGCGAYGTNPIDFLLAAGLTFDEAIEEIAKLL